MTCDNSEEVSTSSTPIFDKKSLLVVDDDKTVRKLINHTMSRYGYEVVGVETAEEGEEKLNSGEFPVALVDINLPGMSGIELVRHFATDISVAIILFTGNNATYSYDQAIHEGATDFLLKPVRLEELALRIDRAMETRRLRMTQEKMVKDLERLAIIDDLTGIFNRRWFTKRLNEETARAARYGRPLSLMMMDIDHFKKLNDEYGHVAGDVALKALSNLLQSDVRTTDQTFRYGGEEFVVLLPEIKQLEAAGFAERLRKEIEKLRFDDYPQCEITVSIGVTDYINDESPTTFVERADKAMYTAKQSGRNQVAMAPIVINDNK